MPKLNIKSLKSRTQKILEKQISCNVCMSEKLILRDLSKDIYEISCGSCGSKFIIHVGSNGVITDDTKLLIKATARIFRKEGEKIHALYTADAYGFDEEKDIAKFEKFKEHVLTKHKPKEFQEIAIHVLSLLRNTSTLASLISLRMSPSMRMKVSEQAQKNGLSTAEYIRKAISESILEEELESYVEQIESTEKQT